MDDAQKSQAGTEGESNHVDAHIGGNVAGENVTIGNHNTINNYYSIIEKNTEKHEPDYWALKHPYPMPPNFTGRLKERATLTHWLKDDSENRLFILRALGGFGKSALSWHWLTHDVDEKEFPKVLWWSFYEGDASFEHFVEETLKYLNCDAPQGKRAQVDELLKAMQGGKILLILDGFERALRAYSSMNAAYQGDEEPKLDDNQLDCTDINAEWFLKGVCSLPKMQGKVLMTTRLTPRAVKPRGECLQGCREVELTAMDKADAVLFFQRQKIKGTHAEIEAACEPYGYHPLSLRLLAGRIVKDFEHPGDIVVAQHLKINGDIVQQKHHVLEVSYNSLPAREQKLLSTIACFRSAVELKTIEAIVGATLLEQPAGNFAPGGSPLHDQLHDLIERGLLHRTTKTQTTIPHSLLTIFDLHPIVRRYAYDRLTAVERTGAHERLVNYFEAVPKPEKVEKLEDLAPVIELYHHMVRAGNLDDARKLFKDRLDTPTYYQFGAYQLQIELLRSLFLDGEDKPPHLKAEGGQAQIINDLGAVYGMSGQPHSSVKLREIVNAMLEKAGDKMNLAIGLGNMATQQLVIGTLSAAEHNLRRRIDLSRETENDGSEAIGHLELGRILYYRGMWNESEKELLGCQKTFDKYGVSRTNYVSVVRAYLAQLFMFMNRVNDALKLANESLDLAIVPNRSVYGGERDIIRARWILGSAYSANNELTLAEENLSKALNLCRQINLVEMEANILLEFARLRYASHKNGGTSQDDLKDAQEKASEALMITERCGYVLQGADVHLFLATLAENGYKLEDDKDLSDKDAALVHAREALKLATCDGPPYTYKVAYEEAERIIQRLKDER